MAESSSPAATPAAATMTWKGRIRVWLKRFVYTAILLVAIGAILLMAAEHHTAKPSFCGSCHIMEPYYASWEADLHGGKLGAACVDCHYAPGERTTVKAKLRGLSQVASYVSGRYGSTRPRAHVSNLSCTTSKCHGDGRFLDKEITLGTVKFVHAKHLKYGQEKRKAVQQELAVLTDSFRGQLGDQRLNELEMIAKEAGPAKDRIRRMTELTSSWNLPLPEKELEQFSILNHRQVRVAQLDDLQCTNCHTYSAQEPGLQRDGAAHHFTATTTSCYTCHFNNEGFNSGTNRCLLCHTLPTQQITVHPEMSPEDLKRLNSSELTQAPVKMDHQSILERKVDCIACHADVASEDSLVTRRDCERCHDQARYFSDWKEPITLDLVTKYHKAHVPEQRAKCLDCHSEIHHELVREKPSASNSEPGFIAAAISNCTYCHPHQHAEQVNLLRGAGGVGVPESTPNMMFGARTNCYGCHTKVVLEQAMDETISGCTACHGDKHTATFEKWKLGIEISMTDAQQAYDNARTTFEQATDLEPEVKKHVSDVLAGAKADMQLVNRGNGVHNVTYAMELLDSVTQRCQEALTLMEEAGAENAETEEAETEEAETEEAETEEAETDEAGTED
jgi:nitrate/TMAO reductase-like tetraheme cytochrome c subunit